MISVLPFSFNEFLQDLYCGAASLNKLLLHCRQ